MSPWWGQSFHLKILSFLALKVFLILNHLGLNLVCTFSSQKHLHSCKEHSLANVLANKNIGDESNFDDIWAKSVLKYMYKLKKSHYKDIITKNTDSVLQSTKLDFKYWSKPFAKKHQYQDCTDELKMFFIKVLPTFLYISERILGFFRIQTISAPFDLAKAFNQAQKSIWTPMICHDIKVNIFLFVKR